MRKVIVVLIVLLMSLSAMAIVPVAIGENNPPMANGGPDKYAGTEDTIYFDGSDSSDPDGDPLTYSWDFDDTNGIQEDATGVLVSTVYNAVGTYTVTLTVSDGNFTDEDTVEVTIEEDHVNRAPTAGIAEPGDYSIFNDTIYITFDGSDSTDPDGDLLSYDWDFGNGESDTGKVVEYKYVDPGIYTVTLTVDDGEFDASTSITIFIEGAPGIPGLPGLPPISPSEPRPVSNANGPYNSMVNEEVFLDSSGTSGGNRLEYCWDLDASNGINTQTCFDEDATWDAWNQEPDYWHDTAHGPYPVIYYKQPGNYTVTLIVRMVHLEELPVNVPVFYTYNFSTTQANIRPHDTVKVDAGKDRDIESGKKANLIATAKIEPEFRDEVFIECEWDFDGDGEYDFDLEFDAKERLKKATCAAVHTYVINDTSSKQDTVYIAEAAFTAQVNLHLYPCTNSSRQLMPPGITAWGNDTTNLTIPAPPNQPPVVTTASTHTAFVGESTSFTCEATDPDGDDIVLYEWDFNNDGTVDSSNPATCEASYTYKSPGQYVAKVNVTDDRGGVGYGEVNVTVRPNKLPQPIIDAPEQGDAGEEIDFDASESSDPDGPDEIVSYSWDFDASDGVGSDATGEYVSWIFKKGGTYTVTLTVRDKHGATATATHDITITQRFDVSLSLNGGPSVEVEPGKTTTFKFRITNTGNGDDCFDIEKSGTKATWGEFSTNQACLGSGQARDFELRVAVPFSAKAEDQASISVTATSQGSSSAADEVRVTVKTKASYEVSVWMQSTSVELKQGKSSSMSVKVTNLGNGDDTIKLSATGADKSWARFKAASINLGSKESKDTTVTFIVPKSAKTGEHTITILAESAGSSTAKDSLVFVITVKKGDVADTLPGFEAMGAVMALVIVGLAAAGIRRRH